MPVASPLRETVHATAVAIREAGVLIRGQSGTGKTALALALLDRAAMGGIHAGLVGDDRIRLERHHGRLVAGPHPDLAGLAEVRGHGIRRLAATHDAAVVRLVVDLGRDDERLPEHGADRVTLLDVALPRLTLGPGLLRSGLGVRLVFDALDTQAVCVAAQTHLPILAAWHDGDP
ncbi:MULTISPECIES: hypothetical protein [unclassified Methylobacterium]|uniref:HPr kinase/phosphorylase n=1 Tax=unclassified Methylobacterium TaxID=2615210 RepID=UPI0009E6A2A0|nr:MULTISPECIES: hypothetical protein [unclassified Methylobacterium]